MRATRGNKAQPPSATITERAQWTSEEREPTHFATVRHRTGRAKGCVNRDGMLTFIFKLGMCAEKNWRRMRGLAQLTKVVTGVKCKDGIEVTDQETECGVAA